MGGDYGAGARGGTNGHFNPRPREGGDVKGRIAALGDKSWRLNSKTADKFQSTPPARGATVLSTLVRWVSMISIHAPREGGDDKTVRVLIEGGISIHAPREGGDAPRSIPVPAYTYFNPRPPRGGRRYDGVKTPAQAQISIHAPPRGGRR